MSQTPGEYLRTSSRRLGHSKERAAVLNSKFEEALFGMREPSNEELAELRREVAELRTELRKHPKEKAGAGSRG